MEPLKIEVGGVYRTRDEQLVLITRVGRYSRVTGAFVGQAHMAEWLLDGRWCDFMANSPEDLVKYLGNINDLPALKSERLKEQAKQFIEALRRTTLDDLKAFADKYNETAPDELKITIVTPALTSTPDSK